MQDGVAEQPEIAKYVSHNLPHFNSARSRKTWANLFVPERKDEDYCCPCVLLFITSAL